jgi:tRNA(Leu) C34 or U34 (ribose-2'-O)-methylase TrmL
VAAFLAARKIAVFAATPAAQKRYWDADFCRPAALLLGSEKDGLSPFWLEAAGQTAPTAASFAPAATSFAPTTASLAPAATSLAPTAASLAPAAASLAPTAGRAASASSVFPALEPIAIPQAGLSDSLNVGVAGAVCLFEAVRQRALANP